MLFLKYGKIVSLGTLGMPEQTHLKLWHQFTALLEIYLHSKNLNNQTNYGPNYSCEVADLLSSMPCHTHQKEIVSTCRKL